MKRSRQSWIVLLLFLVLLRLAITIRGGSVSADDIAVLTDCFNWWKHGKAAELAAIQGSAGFVYIGFHDFIWAAFAGIVSFRLAPLFVVHAVLMTAPALLVGWQFRSGPSGRLASLIALSSPLAAFLSLQLLPIWWLSFFGGSVALHVAAAEERKQPIGSGGWAFVGLFTGYLCGIYPSLSPLALGLLFWALLKRKTPREYGIYLAGCGIGFLPFVVLQISLWSRLTPQIHIGKGSLSSLELLGGIFRYFGAVPTIYYVNSLPRWVTVERGLQDATVVLWLILLCGWICALARARLGHRTIPSEVLLAACCFAAFIPFTLITRTESWYHQAANLWWIPALVVPWSARELAPRLATGASAGIVGFNVLGLLVLFGPRLLLGTTTEGADSDRGRGPSWWMQEQIVRQIKMRADLELAAGVTSPIAIKTDAIYAISYSLPRLLAIQHPELDSKIKWVGVALPRSNLVVTRDRSSPNRLRLAEPPDIWHRPEQPERTVIEVQLFGGYEQSGQIAVDIGNADFSHAELLDRDGKSVPFWLEPGPEGTKHSILWLRLPTLPPGLFTIYAYHGGRPLGKGGPDAPGDVFEFFDNFDHGFTRWTQVGRAAWAFKNGVCEVTMPAESDDEAVSEFLVRDRPLNRGIVEARLRFLSIPTPDDVGLVFAARPGENAYLWFLDGQGLSYLRQIRPTPKSGPIEASNWYWKPKIGRWTVLTAQWSGPSIVLRIDGRVAVDTVSLGETGQGSVGLGTARGSGQPKIEIEWFRIRTNYQNPPHIGALRFERQ